MEKRLATVVELLCSPDYQPRTTGAEGAVATGKYLVDRLESLGLTPAGELGFFQEIPGVKGANVLGALPGRSERWVVLGAHYDACEWDNPGADDNAAGVAITLEVADQLRAMDLKHSVLIALFDAEEPPHFLTPEMGSQWFVDHPTIPLDQIDTMICLDLVGHALGSSGLSNIVRNSVFVLGAEKGSGTPELFDALPDVPGLVPRRVDNYVVPSMSDYDAFKNASIPFLFYSCGRWEHYHAPTDTPDRLDYSKMAALVTHLVALMSTLGERTDRPAYIADGFDDAATLGTVATLLDEFRQHAEEATATQPIVEAMRERLNQHGSLTDEERQLIAFMVFQLEESLS
jgi:hypothetical protein